MSIEVNIHTGSFTLPSGDTHYATLYVSDQARDIHAIADETERRELLMAVADTYLARRPTDGNLTIALPERNVARIDDTDLPEAQRTTICRIMQQTFGLYVANAPIKIPGIVNGGIRQCYANALIHVLFDRWAAPLDRLIGHLDQNPEFAQRVAQAQDPLTSVIRQLLELRRLYTDNQNPIPAAQVTVLIDAVNSLRGTEGRGNDDPIQFVGPLIQEFANHQQYAQHFAPGFEQLQRMQQGSDHRQPFVTLNLSGKQDSNSIQSFVQSRTPQDQREFPKTLPIHVVRTNASGTAYQAHAIPVTEQITVNGQRYQLTSAILHDRHDAARSHHIAYVKTDTGWIKADDSQTSRVQSTQSLMHDLGQHGLLLQYTRIDRN